MAERKCSACGIQEADSWSTCPNCNIQVCDSCSKKQLEENKKLRDLREGSVMDPTQRLKATCPSCGHHLIHMG